MYNRRVSAEIDLARGGDQTWRQWNLAMRRNAVDDKVQDSGGGGAAKGEMVEIAILDICSNAGVGRISSSRKRC